MNLDFKVVLGLRNARNKRSRGGQSGSGMESDTDSATDCEHKQGPFGMINIKNIPVGEEVQTSVASSIVKVNC